MIFDNTVTCSFDENDRQLVLQITNEHHVPQLHHFSDHQVAAKSITNAVTTAKLMSITAKQIESLKNNFKAGVYIFGFTISNKLKYQKNCTFKFEYYKKIKNGQFKEKLSDNDEYDIGYYNKWKDN